MPAWAVQLERRSRPESGRWPHGWVNGGNPITPGTRAGGPEERGLMDPVAPARRPNEPAHFSPTPGRRI